MEHRIPQYCNLGERKTAVNQLRSEKDVEVVACARKELQRKSKALPACQGSGRTSAQLAQSPTLVVGSRQSLVKSGTRHHGRLVSVMGWVGLRVVWREVDGLLTRWSSSASVMKS